MAPPSTGAARRATAPQARPATRRPPLRILEREPRRTLRRDRSQRAHLWLAACLLVGSLLVVVAGDALVAQGQVRLAKIQLAIATQQATQKSMQTQVAQLAAPDRVVAQGIALGLTAPAQVVDLPQVPLNVPLPVPDTAAAPVPATVAPSAAKPATATPATATPATATPATAPATTTPTPATATIPSR